MIQEAGATGLHVFWPREMIIALGSLCVGILACGTAQALTQPASDSAAVREMIQLGHSSNNVLSVAFSPDGRLVLTGSGDETARLWETESGRELHRFEGHTRSVSSVAFSPSGDQVLTGSEDGTARLWETASGKELRRFSNMFERRINCVAQSSNGFHAAAGGRNGAYLFDLPSGQEIRRFEGHTDQVTSIAFSPDGRYLLTGGGFRDKTARLWDVVSGRERSVFSGYIDEVTSVAFSPDGRYIIAAAKNRIVHLWNASTGDVRKFEMPSNLPSNRGLNGIVFSPNGKYFLVGGDDGTARMWDVLTGREVRQFRGAADFIRSISSSPDSRLIISGSAGGAHLWETATGGQVRRFQEHADVRFLAVSRNARYLLTGVTTIAKLWEISTGQEVRSFDVRNEAVFDGVFSRDERFVLTGSGDKTARLWDVDTGQIVRTFKGHKGMVTSVALSPDDRYVITASVEDNTVRLWETNTGQEVLKFEGVTERIICVVFSPDGRQVLTGSSSSNLARLWDTASGRELRKFNGHTGSVRSVAFTPDGRFVLTGSDDRTARLWDVDTAQEIRRYEGHAAGVVSASFFSKGRHVLTGSSDHTTRIWSSDTGKELIRLVSFTDGTWVVSTPDGRFDTNNLEEIKGLHWIMPDDPLRALPLEIFMRDYYEPRLLPRVFAGERLPAVRSLAQLNRAQPTVEIVGVDRERDSRGHPGETVSVTVRVIGASHEFGLERQKRLMETGAYDLRLFRDGQLVAQEPPLGNRVAKVGSSVDEELQQWRQERRVVDLKEGARQIVFKGIRLPRRAGLKEVQFSAYAFNEDRVKSATARTSFAIPVELSPRLPRAYIVSVGVNAFEDARLELGFAVNDATRLGEVLTSRLKAQRNEQGHSRYEDVVWVGLTAEEEIDEEGNRHLTTVHARKAQIAAVLKVLAGQTVKAKTLDGITYADKLRRANPEDRVIIAFSTHGEVDERGQFYLLPHDIGSNPTEQQRRTRAISSDELSEWLQGLDAIDLVMIVDACHSAASVQSADFKPGPMGSRGLGQLAYDKGMRILVATQIDQYALETQTTQQGLLSYALVHEGLAHSKADYKPQDQEIWLSEWLSYASERVPGLYADVRTGKLKSRAALPLDEPQENVRLLQQPALFDFARGRDLPLMVGVRQ